MYRTNRFLSISSPYGLILLIGRCDINGQELRAILGKGIRFYRKQRNLSQAALAEKSGISITFLSNIERGIKYPTSDTLAAIARSLKTEVYELFRHDNSPSKNRTLFERFKTEITRNVLDTLETTYKEYDK
jgi:transcriptional regulator with XRE-family HTH domain